MALSFGPMVAEADVGSLPVYVEDSPAAQEWIEEADQLRAEDRVSEAVELLQKVIEQYERKLVPVAPGRYVDAGRHARRRIVEDERLRQSYSRRYDAAAERDLLLARESPPAQRAAAFDALLAQYELTSAGLEASLDRAAIYLEQADGVMAQNLLERAAEHPNLAPFRERYHRLSAIAAVFNQDDKALMVHRDALAEITDPGEVDRLAAGLDRLATPSVGRFEPPSAPGGPLWEVKVASAATNPAPNRRNARQQTQRITWPVVTALQPVVAGDEVLLGDGQRLRSLDRFSGRTRWVLEKPEIEQAAQAVAAMTNRTPQSPSAARVAVAGRRVYAVLGSVGGWPMRVANQAGDTRLFALDRESGETIWGVKPAELDPTLERAFFHGTPRVGLDRVYVMLRRTQLTGFQDAVVAALDADTGRLLWKRHVSSTATANRFGIGPAPTMTLAGDTLYISDQLGAVVAIEARDGGFRWMRVFDITTQTNASGRANLVRQYQPSYSRWPSSDPIVVPAGLVVSLIRESAGRVLLDPESGTTLRDLNGESIAEARSLFDADGRILGVEHRVLTLYDGGTLEPIWTRELQLLDDREDEVFAGWPDIANGYAAMTTNHRLLVYRLGDGEVVYDSAVTGPGNVVIVDGQLLLASGNKLLGYMDWDLAYEKLIGRAEDSPRDHKIGLALAHLGMGQGRSGAVIEGVDLAMSALTASDRHAGLRPQTTADIRARVFDEVVALVEADSEIDPDSKSELFDRLATLAADPAQEAAYHLSFGAFLAAQGRPEEAVEQYQFILLDESLESQLYRQPTLTRQAGLEARGRIEQLIAEHGRSVYNDFDRLAAQRLAELSDPASPEPRALARLADRYPVSLVAPEALYLAGETYADMGENKLAVRYLRSAYRTASDPALLARVVGRLVAVQVDLQRPQVAAHWLRRAARDHPGLTPTRDGQPKPVDLWLMELSMLDRIADSLPRIDLPLGTPFEVEGRLMMPVAQGDLRSSTNHFMTRKGASVAMYSEGSTTPNWEAELDDPHAELLALTDHQALFWSDREARLTAYDAETGKPSWETIDIEAVLDRVGEARVREDLRPREQRQFVRDLNPAGLVIRDNRLVLERNEAPAGYLLAVNDTVVCVADRAGRITAIDRVTGEPIWQQLSQLDRLDHIAIDEQNVAFSGMAFPDTATASQAILILDAISGAPRRAPSETTEATRWLGFGDEGRLISVSDSRVTLRDPDTGQVPWRLDFYGRKSGDMNWIADGLLLVVTETDTTRVLVVIDTQAGRVLNRFALSSGRGGPVRVHRLDEGWVIGTPDAVFCIDSLGQLLWRDALRTRGTIRIDASGVTDRFVILASSEPDEDWPGVANGGIELDGDRLVAIGPNGERAHRIWFLDRLTGRIFGEQPVYGRGSALWRLLPLEQRLVVGSLERTLVYPANEKADGTGQ